MLGGWKFAKRQIFCFFFSVYSANFDQNKCFFFYCQAVFSFSIFDDCVDHTKGRKEVSKLNAEKISSAPGD